MKTVVAACAIAACAAYWLRQRARRHRRSYARGLHSVKRETLLIELPTLSSLLEVRILAKCEFMQPGGSVKDRAAHALIDCAVASGALEPGGTIIQGTGGNTGISLAMIARARGYRCHLTIPENISPDKTELMRLLGAEITVCPCVPFKDSRSYMSVADALHRTTPNSAKPCQFENLANSSAHYSTTGPEMWEQSGRELDGFVCAAGTGGTIAGVSRYLKEVNPSACTYLIDPTGSGLKCFVETGTFASSGSCFIDGIGIGRETANFATAKVDGAFRGDDEEAIEMAHWLLRNEGIFVGPSAALNVVGAVKLARRLKATGDGGRRLSVATVLCDGGERYRATTYNSAWLKEKGLTPKGQGTDLSFIKA
jgi:cysteine synthase A